MSGDFFGLRLKELREGAGLSQAELAASAKLTRDGVSQLEQGRRRPSWDTVLALAEALGVDCRAFHDPPAADLAVRKPSQPPKVVSPAETTPKKIGPIPASELSTDEIPIVTSGQMPGRRKPKAKGE
jgi:transcriptional regulator with XRE-family HTH domain